MILKQMKTLEKLPLVNEMITQLLLVRLCLFQGKL